MDRRSVYAKSAREGIVSTILISVLLSATALMSVTWSQTAQSSDDASTMASSGSVLHAASDRSSTITAPTIRRPRASRWPKSTRTIWTPPTSRSSSRCRTRRRQRSRLRRSGRRRALHCQCAGRQQRCASSQSDYRQYRRRDRRFACGSGAETAAGTDCARGGRDRLSQRPCRPQHPGGSQCTNRACPRRGTERSRAHCGALQPQCGALFAGRAGGGAPGVCGSAEERSVQGGSRASVPRITLPRSIGCRRAPSRRRCRRNRHPRLQSRERLGPQHWRRRPRRPRDSGDTGPRRTDPGDAGGPGPRGSDAGDSGADPRSGRHDLGQRPGGPGAGRLHRSD